MRLSRTYDIQLFVNSNAVDLPKDFDLALNTKVYDPEAVLSKTADYSYSFKLPTTPKNNVIFGYANVLSVPSKFIKTYDAELNVDGMQVFNGRLRINSISNNEYNCNLVVVKVNTVEAIFGDSTLNMIDWKVDFDGISTINEVNSDESRRYYFPLICYGAFAKNPVKSYSTYNDYTSIYSIDFTNKFYVSTFYPSLAVTDIVKKCFEYKGYSTEGTFFTDSHLKNLYMSTNLASEQVPIYNLGNDKFGHCSLSVDFKNYYKYRERRGTGTTYPVANGTIQQLQYPYNQYQNTGGYDFDSVQVYNLLEPVTSRTSPNRSSAYTWTNDIVNSSNYLYSKDDGAITIPADGLYAIRLAVSASTVSASTHQFANEMKVHQHKTNETWMASEAEEVEVTIGSSTNWNYREWKPMEIQLVRNFNNDIELIKGNKSWYHNGLAPTNSNSIEINTAYPHEETKASGSTSRTTFEIYPTTVIDGSNPEGNDAYYMPKEGEMLFYDPLVNPNFIMGFSTIGECPSIIKNGYSWYKGNTETNDSRVNSYGYFEYLYDLSNVGTVTSSTRCDYHKDSCNGAPTTTFSFTNNGSQMNGSINALVYLKKDDRLSLHAVLRNYDTFVDNDRSSWSNKTYPVEIRCELDIKAMSPNHSDVFFDNGKAYDSASEFDSQLNLADFLNKETKMSDFVSDIIKSFNLSYSQNGSIVTLDTQKRTTDAVYAVNIDDRTNANGSEISIDRIQYPSSLSVQYSINTNEAGFYNSVPKDKINREDWEDYGDKGYDVIQLDNTGDSNDAVETLQNSYCWYESFTISHPSYTTVTNPRGDENTYMSNSAETQTRITIPVIAESRYFIDKGDIEEYMKRDGYSLSRRFFFRNTILLDTVPTVYSFSGATQVNLYSPTRNDGYDLVLNYKEHEMNVLEKYFNLSQKIDSNYITVDAYLTATEYFHLKNGARVVYDSDLYDVVEISKYSVARKNKATLKLMKL